jgi:hypothetical protein
VHLVLGGEAGDQRRQRARVAEDLADGVLHDAFGAVHVLFRGAPRISSVRLRDEAERAWALASDSTVSSSIMHGVELALQIAAVAGAALFFYPEGVDAVGLEHIGLARRENEPAIAKVHHLTGPLDVEVEVQLAAAAQGINQDRDETSGPGGRLGDDYRRHGQPAVEIINVTKKLPRTARSIAALAGPQSAPTRYAPRSPTAIPLLWMNIASDFTEFK